MGKPKIDPRTTPSFQAILRENYEGMLEMDSRKKKVFPTCPMVVNKRGKNMKEALCRAKLPPQLASIRTRSAAAQNRVTTQANRRGTQYQHGPSRF